MMIFYLQAESEHGFSVHIVQGVLSDRSTLARAIADRRALIVTTPSVADLYGMRIRHMLRDFDDTVHLEVIDIDEQSKSIESALAICSLAAKYSIDRRGVLVAIGGGVCSDAVGFAASIYRRGISHIRVPTTLVGQVDAGIGLKCGVNYEGRKNNLGAFHAPESVLIDYEFLHTLPAVERRQGLSEMIKIATVRDDQLFSWLEMCVTFFTKAPRPHEDPIAGRSLHRSIELMLEELEDNPFEDRSLARLVDYGHSFSPALESASNFTLPHGDAVAVDMALSCVIANELNLLPMNELQRKLRLLRRCALPIFVSTLTPQLAGHALDSVTLHRGNSLNLVLPTSIGRGTFARDRSAITDDVLNRCIARLAAYDVTLAGHDRECVA